MRLTFHKRSVVFATALGLVACGGKDEEDEEFAITSPAFTDGTALPAEFTCAGKNFPYSGMPPVDHVLPQLNWTSGPDTTQSYAIVFTDVTLTTVTAERTTIDERGYHWAIYNIPANVRTLPKGLPSGANPAQVPGATQYSGALFNNGFVGPCPSWSVAPGSPLLGMTPAPTVSTDTYTFTIYALPFAAATLPAMRPAPAEGAAPISYVKDLNEYFLANAIETAVLHTTSDAQPAMFATPPATM